jgi:hypothetical protein
VEPGGQVSLLSNKLTDSFEFVQLAPTAQASPTFFMVCAQCAFELTVCYKFPDAAASTNVLMELTSTKFAVHKGK